MFYFYFLFILNNFKEALDLEGEEELEFCLTLWHFDVSKSLRIWHLCDSIYTIYLCIYLFRLKATKGRVALRWPGALKILYVSMKRTYISHCPANHWPARTIVKDLQVLLSFLQECFQGFLDGRLRIGAASLLRIFFFF